MDDCVTKPYTLATLNSCLERWLAGRAKSSPRLGQERPSPQSKANITAKGEPPADRDEWAKVKDKLAAHFSPNPGTGS